MVICILGGVGSGKSEVLRIFQENHAALIIQADQIAHQLYAAGKPGYDAIRRICGEEYVDENEVIRSKLSQFLVEKPQFLNTINHAIHPLVYQEISDIVFNNPQRLIIEEQAVIPEQRFPWMDTVWYIYSSIEIRKKRLRETRGYSDQLTDTIISKQPSEAQFREFSDIVIENNGNIKELEDKIDENLKYCKWQQR